MNTEKLAQRIYDRIKNLVDETITMQLIKDIIDEHFTVPYYTCHFDGSAKPNPGVIRAGYVIKTPDGKTADIKTSVDLGHGTNNQAEYYALRYLIEKLLELKAQKVIIYGDSQLAINQVNGIWQAKDKTMKKFRDEIRNLLEGIPEWKIIHVPRNQNKDADMLTR